MIIERVDNFSELGGEALERARESVVVWRLRYGERNGSVDHTIAYFGVITTNAICARGFLWLELLLPTLTLAERKHAYRAWLDFYDASRWSFLAFAERDNLAATRFLRFLRFEEINSDASYLYYEGPAKWQ